MSTNVVKDSVVREESFGAFIVQILEGPTDNPIRVLGPARRAGSIRASYTFGIEGEGWNILVDILGLPGQPANRSSVPYHLSCLISLVRNFPSNFGLLEIDLSSAKDWTELPEGTYLLHGRSVYLKRDVPEKCTDCHSLTPNIIVEIEGAKSYLCGQCDIGG